MRIIGVLAFFLCLTSCKNDDEINKLDKLSLVDVKLGIPKSGEWLAQHEEKGQSFAQYCREEPVSVTFKRNAIYIQPIGNFSEKESKIVKHTVEYVQLFFNLKTVQLKSIPESRIPADKKRMNAGVEQLEASYINQKILPKKVPEDGIVIMAITAKDLYPSKEWNYVFGLANYKNRTGISSFNRFLTNENYTLCLERTIKTASHEIGHMFSIHHCINAVCLMNGVNHIVESDTKPNRLCSECLKKLSWNLKFDDEDRLKKLIAFLKLHKLEKDALLLQQQLNILSKK